MNGVLQKEIIKSWFSLGVDELSWKGIISEWFNGGVDGVLKNGIIGG